MTQIPGITASVAQTHVTQKNQSDHKEKVRQAAGEAAARAQRQSNEQREFVRDMAEATGLVVDPDGKNEQETRKRKRLLDLNEQEDQIEIDGEQPEQSDAQARDHAAALLMDSDQAGPRTPPPCMIDIEA